MLQFSTPIQFRHPIQPPQTIRDDTTPPRTELFKTVIGIPTLGALALISLALTGSSQLLAADMIDVVDIAGRTVEVPAGAERVILGEGRMMYSVAVLNKEDPFGRVIGWKDDLIKYDPDAFRKFEEKFPEQVSKIKNFGSPYSGDFSIETAIDMEADLVILDLGNLFKAEQSGVIENLEKAGIPVVFIDFRIRPDRNTIPSLQLLGQVFDAEEQAKSFIDFYRVEMSKVSNVVDTLDSEERPMVFIESAPGWNPGFCCNTFGAANFGKMVEDAGGINWGSRQFSGYSSEVSFEAVLDDDPEVVIGTGANWAEDRPEVTSVLLGYDAEAPAVQEKLGALSERKGFNSMQAVTNKRFHSIYHQFYNSPFRVVALQQFATWLHPEEFSELDPEATFEALHKQFLPFDYEGVFWATLD